MTATALESGGDTMTDAMPEHLASATAEVARPTGAGGAGGTGSAEPTTAAAEPLPLRRNRNFNLLWGGAVSALLGLSTADSPAAGDPGADRLAAEGRPVRHGPADRLGAGDPAGRAADGPQGPAPGWLLLSESVRTIAAASVAVADFLGVLTFWYLLLTAAMLGDYT